MSRKKVKLAKREILPDAKYNDKIVGKFINMIMKKGEKAIALGLCYNAFNIIQQKTDDNPLKVFRSAVDNVKPILEVKSRRVGGASYQVPVDIRPARKTALALRWIIKYAGNRSGKSMEEKLASELIDASHRTGGAVKKREETHRMAEANKAFAHYRW
ncbi:MAG: 30S ribosomal protein S7 [Nitrospirota bacterium]